MKKSSNIAYLFDFDGTIIGTDEWTNYIKHTWHTMNSSLYINPHLKDIRWSILTSRPLCDTWIVKLACLIHDLHPYKSFYQPTLFWKFKNSEEEYKFKVDTMKNILDDPVKFGYSAKLDRIMYVDNKQEILTYVNSHRDGYPILAVNSLDFWNESFDNVLL